MGTGFAGESFLVYCSPGETDCPTTVRITTFGLEWSTSGWVPQSVRTRAMRQVAKVAELYRVKRRWRFW